jgi:hypothetical protein
MAKTWGSVANTGLSKSTLENGVYEVKVTKFNDKPYAKGDQDGIILDLTLEIEGVQGDLDENKYVGARAFRESWWLTRDEAKRIWFDELKSIGFDVDSWSTDEADPLYKGTMAPAAVRFIKMRGLTLLLKRSTSSDGKYVNLRFVGRKDAKDPPPTIPNSAVQAVIDEPDGAEDIF